MGSPQRQPSYPPDQPSRSSRPGPQLENLRQVDNLDKQVSSGWRFGFWWIWALVIIGIWYVGFGWGGSGGWLRGHRAATVNDAAISGPGVEALRAENKTPFAHQTFQLRNVPVERRASNLAIWIGPKFNSVPTLLILPTGNNPESASIGQGSWIDTNGTIYPAPTAAQAKQQWKLSDADVQQLEKQGAYMQATVVQQVPH